MGKTLGEREFDLRNREIKVSLFSCRQLEMIPEQTTTVGGSDHRRSCCVRAMAQTESSGAAASAQWPRRNPAEPLHPRNGSNESQRSRRRRSAGRTDSSGADDDNRQSATNWPNSIRPSSRTSRAESPRSACCRSTGRSPEKRSAPPSRDANRAGHASKRWLRVCGMVNSRQEAGKCPERWRQ